LRRFIDEAYFGVLRNFHRWGWLISYLFGASPAMCTSFARLRGGRYETLGTHTAFSAYATSLRMSDTGYKNKNQAGLHISYDNLEAYVASLTRAITTVSPEFAKIGVKVDGAYRQLNANLLQIENEYYSFIRPKQIARSGEKPTTALRERGVRYVEVRALDVNPFDPVGMYAGQLRFIELFLLLCLFEPSPVMTASEYADAERNQSLVACCGRNPALEISDRGRPRKVAEWAHALVAEIASIAEVLDRHTVAKHFVNSVAQQLECVTHAELLPSSRILQELRDRGESYCAFSMRLARAHAAHFDALELNPARADELETAAQDSLQAQAALEAQDTVSFDEFLDRYLGTSATP
jgi:glutamate--cysteine ligase